MNKTKTIFVLILFCLVITSVSALESLKPASFNKSYTVLQTCASCTYVNVTISSINGILFSNQAMSETSPGVWAFNITPVVISRHDVTGQGDLDSVDTSFATFFEVTPSGKVSSTGDSILYLLFSVILFGGIFLISFLIFSMPSKNERGERGEENKIVKIKYLRIVLIFLLYPLTILLLNFLTGLASNFSALELFAGILGFLFESLLRLAWPFTFITIAWIIVWLVHDSNLGKKLKKFERMRFP